MICFHYELCFNSNKPEACEDCKRNIKNQQFGDHYAAYPIKCRFGLSDCTHDPGYIWRFRSDYYEKHFGPLDSPIVDTSPQCKDCQHGFSLTKTSSD